MLHYLGRGLSRATLTTLPFVSSSKNFDFQSMLPSEFTYTRNDNVATHRDSNGNWQRASVNEPRFDHDKDGNALGLRFEPSRTNKLNLYNFAPINTAGITADKGDATIALVNDANASSATIQGSTFEDLQNGNVIELTAGTSATTFQLTPASGNINPHSWRVCIAADETTYLGTVGHSDGVNISAIQNQTAADYYEYTQDNQSPNNAVRFLRVRLNAGKTVRIIGLQWEEGAFLSDPIVTEGAPATRVHSVATSDNIDQAAWFNTGEGSMVCDTLFDHLGFDNQYVVLASDGSSLNNSIGCYINNGSAHMRGRYNINGASQQNEDVHKPIIGKRFPMAISWNNNESIALGGPMSHKKVEFSGNPVGVDTLYLGGRPFNNSMSGWVKSLNVYDTYRTVSQLGSVMLPSSQSYHAIVSAGQSNKEGYFRSEVESGNSGEVNATAEMDLVYPMTENWMLNGAKNGSFAIKANDPNVSNANANWWYDPLTGDFGPRMVYWEEIVRAFGGDRIIAIDWDQGESDANTSIAALKTAWLAIFNHMRSVIGDKPVFITPIGRRSDFQSAGYNNLRQAQRELAEENSWIRVSIEKIIQPLADQVHLTDAGYGAHATQHMRFMLGTLGQSVSGGFVPPYISGVSRSGLDVDVVIAHGAGADFDPAMNIAGFHFYDGGSEIPINTQIRVDANTIRLTLNALPTGVETFYYGYGSLIDEVATYADLVVDDSTYQLPLQASVWEL